MEQVLVHVVELLAPERERDLLARIEARDDRLKSPKRFAHRNLQLFEAVRMLVRVDVRVVKRLGAFLHLADVLRQILLCVFEPAGLERAEDSLQLRFAEKNQGMTRVLIGDALVNEDERLQVRMNQLYDRIEAALRQALKIAQAGGAWNGDPVAEANALLAYVLGRWMLFAKSGFKRMPQEHWETQRKYLFG